LLVTSSGILELATLGDLPEPIFGAVVGKTLGLVNRKRCPVIMRLVSLTGTTGREPQATMPKISSATNALKKQFEKSIFEN